MNTPNFEAAVTRAVVKLLLKPWLAFPARSVTPPPTLTVTLAFGGSATAGVNVAVAPLTA